VNPAFTNTGKLSATTTAGRYLVERIVLNRAQLVLERRLAGMLSSLAEFEDWGERSLSSLEFAEAKEMIAVLLSVGHPVGRTAARHAPSWPAICF
jgi:hypothetical protein